MTSFAKFLNFFGVISGVIGSLFTNLRYLGVTGPYLLGGLSTLIEEMSTEKVSHAGIIKSFFLAAIDQCVNVKCT